MDIEKLIICDFEVIKFLNSRADTYKSFWEIMVEDEKIY